MMNTKYLISAILIMASLYTLAHSGSSEDDMLESTEYLSFHNNYWINLHHFYYELASLEQRTKLKEDGINYLDNGDAERIDYLNTEDRVVFNATIEYYKAEVIDQPLIASGKLLKWLEHQKLDEEITDTTYGADFTEMLNQACSVYRPVFWKHHQAQNQALLGQYIELIRGAEDQVILKMEELSGWSWRGRVRVDLSAYGNWAGAYSPADDNIVVSTIDPMMHSTLFIEFVFHESSHLMFSRSSPFRSRLYESCKEIGAKYPRQLWHAAMFYLTGMATSEALEALNVSHKTIMEQKNVFNSYYAQVEFREILDDYYRGSIDLDTMAFRLLTEVKS